MRYPMQRRVLLPLLCLACATPAVAGAAAKTSWAQQQIKLVTSRGLMGGDARSFQPDAPLTRGALADLAAALAEQTPAAVVDSSAPATMTQLDASLVRSLGLRSAAAAFSRGARAVGLAPPSRFGN